MVKQSFQIPDGLIVDRDDRNDNAKINLCNHCRGNVLYVVVDCLWDVSVLAYPTTTPVGLSGSKLNIPNVNVEGLYGHTLFSV